MKKNQIVKKILATNPGTSAKKARGWKPLHERFRPAALGRKKFSPPHVSSVNATSEYRTFKKLPAKEQTITKSQNQLDKSTNVNRYTTPGEDPRTKFGKKTDTCTLPTANDGGDDGLTSTFLAGKNTVS